ncbi:MAG: hypothetical protein EGR83_02760 [Bacteroides cellulosilyticus]|nr:hypothetical protein [Bacteroides cellulosilyticus]
MQPPHTHTRTRARKGLEENGDKNRKWPESTGGQGKLTKINIPSFAQGIKESVPLCESLASGTDY